MKTVLVVEEMSCGKCELRVVNAVTKIEGVLDASADRSTRRATIEHADGINQTTLISAIEAAGYPASSTEA